MLSGGTISEGTIYTTTPVTPDNLRSFYDAEAENAYYRPWHRGFRLNRLRRFEDEEAKKLKLDLEPIV